MSLGAWSSDLDAVMVLKSFHATPSMALSPVYLFFSPLLLQNSLWDLGPDNTRSWPLTNTLPPGEKMCALSVLIVPTWLGKAGLDQGTNLCNNSQALLRCICECREQEHTRHIICSLPSGSQALETQPHLCPKPSPL